MINVNDILETIRMIQDENLDIRTITMGISLLDCIDADIDKACSKVYEKITRCAKDLVKTGEDIEREYGIPIINKRISVTPIAIVSAACSQSPVKFAQTMDKAAEAVGVNLIGGYSALVQKGFSAGDLNLIRSIPEALACTSRVCSSVNIGSTKTGINLDACKLMGQIVREAAERTVEQKCFGAAKLVVFCNAPEDNPFMAGAFHGAGEPDKLWTADHDLFLESMADAAGSVVEYFKDRIAYVNVMKNMSVDCDCCAVAEDPCMQDIGVLVSLDPIAIDQACLDLVYASDDPGKAHLIERIESRHGTHTLDHAAAIGLGNPDYELIDIDN